MHVGVRGINMLLSQALQCIQSAGRCVCGQSVIESHRRTSLTDMIAEVVYAWVHVHGCMCMPKACRYHAVHGMQSCSHDASSCFKCRCSRNPCLQELKALSTTGLVKPYGYTQTFVFGLAESPGQRQRSSS